MNDSNFIVGLGEELKSLLINSIADTIKKLKECLPQNAPKQNELLLVQSRLNDINLKKLRGTASEEMMNLEYNRIRENLLEFIDDLKEEDFVIKKELTNNKNGSLLYQVPAKMKRGKEVKCIIRLAYEEASLIRDIELTPATKIKDVRVSKIMHVNLIDPGEGEHFKIRTYNEEEQFIETNDYTEWIFYVEALKDGYHPLVLKVSVVEMINNKERLKNIVFEENILVSAVEEELPKANQFTATDYSFSQAAFANKPIPPAEVAPKNVPTRNTPPKRSIRRSLTVAASFLILLSSTIAIPYALQEREWNKATQGARVDDYERYLKEYPDGKYKEEALNAIKSLELLPVPNSNEAPEINVNTKDAEPGLEEEDKEPSDSPSNTNDASSTEIKNENTESTKAEENLENKLESTIDKESTTESGENIQAPKPDKTEDVTEAVKVEDLPKREYAKGWMIDARDQSKYAIVLINGKYWMAENLRFKTPESWCYQDKDHCKEEGRLYSFRAAKVACPRGWRLPSDEDWKSLAAYLGGYSEKGYKSGMPIAAFSKINKGGFSNFNALMGGMRETNGKFASRGSLGVYWTSSISTQGAAFNYFISSQTRMLHRDNNSARNSGFSCRCIKE